jgi:hypothetical protein
LRKIDVNCDRNVHNEAIPALVFALFFIGTAEAGKVRSGAAMDTYTDIGNEKQIFGPEDTYDASIRED